MEKQVLLFAMTNKSWDGVLAFARINKLLFVKASIPSKEVVALLYFRSSTNFR